MKNLKLDSVLLFALVIPFIMTYRISPRETPYLLFGLIFLSLLSYLILDILPIRVKIFNLSKQILVWFIIVVVIGSAFISAIIVRHQTSPTYMIHDIIIQQESAIHFLLHGKNPYAVNYFDTPLKEWHYSDKETNPALYHFVMEPFYLIFSLPFYFLSNHTIGYFDGRIPLLFLFLSLLVTAAFVLKDQDKKRLFLVLLAFNPAMLGYTLEGRSDIFMFTFLFLGFFLLWKNKISLAGIAIALAFAIKQSAWPIIPFYLGYISFKNNSYRKTVLQLAPFIITFAVIVGPFLIWNSRAFLDSTVYYLSGNTSNAYPISGYGLGSLLNQMGIIKDVHQYYPFQIWQMILGIPLIVILVIYLKKNLSVNRMIIAYGIFLFVFWYFSRYFNNSHLGYLSVVFITAYFWPDNSD